VQRFAVIVANNRSLDEGVPPLAYADDDGAKYFELFQAAGVQLRFLAVLDPDAQQRYPEATAASLPPSSAQLQAALTTLFAQITQTQAAGIETHFYFIYAGHGGLAPNQEGYLNLLDRRLTRSELFREIVARSPATMNHLILDACHAYFLVQKRGQTSDKRGDFSAVVREFLRADELAAYPNTGVILAFSSTSETHEWASWQAGIFSHELQSGLLGPADLDQDGAVSYREIAAFVDSANAAVTDPTLRLRVYARPPASRVASPLFDLTPLTVMPTLNVEPSHAARYHLEDGRGVRLADFHPSGEQATRVALLGHAPFWVRTDDQEAVLAAPSGVVAVGSLAFAPLEVARRGSVEQSFRRYLYHTPFSVGFMQGMQAMGSTEPLLDLVEVAPGPAPSTHWLRIGGFTGLGGAVVAGGLGAVFYAQANHSYSAYQRADSIPEARELRQTTDQQLQVAQVLFGTAVGLAVTGGGLLVWEWLTAE